MLTFPNASASTCDWRRLFAEGRLRIIGDGHGGLVAVMMK